MPDEEAARKLAEVGEPRRDSEGSCERSLEEAADGVSGGGPEALTGERTAAAHKLEKLAEAQINDLAMKARFGRCAVTASEDSSAWTAHGWDSVECRIATNAGEPLQPLDENRVGRGDDRGCCWR